MSIASLKRSVKRKWRQWIDPEFDGDQYAKRDHFTDEDGLLYYERSRRIINGKIYCLIINEDDKSDFYFRRLDIEDGVEYYIGLDDRDEFNMVLDNFLFESNCADIAGSDIDFFGVLKKVFGDDILNEGSDDCD